MKRRIRVAIAEDHTVVRQGLVALTNERKDMVVMFSAANGVELLDQLKKNKPDVILLDLEMPILDGEEAMKIISSKYPNVKIIVVSMHSGLNYIRTSIAKGANGFIQKKC